MSRGSKFSLLHRMCRNCGLAHLSAILASLVHVFLFCRGCILSCSWGSGCDLGSASQMYSNETWTWNWGKGERRVCETSSLAGENWSNAGMVLEPAVGVVTSWFSRQLEPEPASTSDSPWLLIRHRKHLLNVFIWAWQFVKVTLFSGGSSIPVLTTEKMENQCSRALPMLTRWLELTFNFTFLSFVWLQPALLLLLLFVD